jgi:hypothetical protein
VERSWSRSALGGLDSFLKIIFPSFANTDGEVGELLLVCVRFERQRKLF